MQLHIATIILIAANVVISLRGFRDRYFFDRYKFNISAIRSGQRERTITSGFLHVDGSHLFVNMFTLYFFADVVINWFGPTRFLIIYLISLLAGSLLALYYHRQEPYYSAVGASGAVTGILFAAFLLQPNMNLFLMFIPIPIPAYILGIGYLLYSIYGMKKRIGNIGHTAHFGGAMGGYLATLLFRPQIITTQPMMVLLLALPIVLLFFLQRAGKL